MIELAGELALTGTILLATLAVFCCVASLRFNSEAWARAARWSVFLIFVLFSISSAALLNALLKTDLAIQYVAHYTERDLPIGYKIAAFWAGQEGSLLTWAWLLALVSALAVFTLSRLNRPERTIAVATLAVICGFFGAVLLFAANPFAQTAGAIPPDGRGLNPMLQDLAMIIHPPVLFAGYAAFAVPFAILVGVLAVGRSDDHWLAATRRWLLTAWVLLTAGIVIGAWWAYVELGWGGYWAWDPVENASLLPWLSSTALLHSMMVQQHRGMFRVWNVLLIASSFLLCIFGTYITRSGVIDSVHAFGESVLGTFFLIFMICTTILVAALMIWRRRTLKGAHRLDAMISREGAFLLANILLTLMLITTLVGTIFPLISEVVTGNAVTVGAPFYNRIVAPMALVVVALMATGPVLAFGKNAGPKILRDLAIPAAGALIAVALVAALVTTNGWALLCTGITTLGTLAVIVGIGRSVDARKRSTKEAWPVAFIRLIDRDHRRYGGQFAHLGAMLLVIGVVTSSVFSTTEILRLTPGQTTESSGRQFTLDSIDEVRRVNYTAVEATVTVTERSGRSRTLHPQRRFYDAWPDEPNTEVAIQTTWRADNYVSLAGWERGGAIVAIEIRVNPGVVWIWIGGIVLVVGGIVCALPPLLPAIAHAHAPAHKTESKITTVSPVTEEAMA